MSDDETTDIVEESKSKKKKDKPVVPATTDVIVEANFDSFKRGDRLTLDNSERTAGLLRNGLVSRA